MTIKKLFASLGLLVVLLASPGAAQESSFKIQVGVRPLNILQQNAGGGSTQPQLAPAVKPEPQALPHIFQPHSTPIEPQLTPAQLEELYHKVWEAIGDLYHTPSALKDWPQWEHKYDGRLQKPEDLDKALKELTSSLNDRWTSYLSPTDIAQAMQDVRAGIVDLGMQLKQEPNGTYRVDYLSWGSAAQKSDIRKGDTIKSIGGKSLTGMSAEQVEKLLKGKVGSKVSVVYIAAGKDMAVDLTFAQTPTPSVEFKLLPGNIAYIRLPHFMSEDTVVEFMAAVADLDSQAKGALEGIVFDLRGNPGGQFQLAIMVSSLFLEKGTIVTSTRRNGRVLTHESYETIPVLPHTITNPPNDFNKVMAILQTKPLVVLTDGSTASAAEIVTGALKDNGRATIIGDTTYGKGVGYVSGSLPTGGVVLITTLDYLTPSGFNLSNKGIQPHQIVDQPRGSLVDEQLNAGVKAVKDKVLSPTTKPNDQRSDSTDPRALFTILLVALLLVVHLRRSR